MLTKRRSAAAATTTTSEQRGSELSMGRVDPWVGMGWHFQFSVGCVGFTTAKVLKIWKDYANAFKARLDKIWLHQAVKFDFTAKELVSEWHNDAVFNMYNDQ